VVKRVKETRRTVGIKGDEASKGEGSEAWKTNGTAVKSMCPLQELRSRDIK